MSHERPKATDDLRIVAEVVLASIEALALIALALPLLYFALINAAFGYVGGALVFLGIVGWGAVELFSMLLQLVRSRKDLLGSARRTAYALVTAAVIVRLIESPDTDRRHWVRFYWFLIALLPLVGALFGRALMKRDEHDAAR
jgi:hypothetical protein